MSERAQNRLLTLLGVITAIVTVAIQILSVGELKGKLETVIDSHDRRLDAAETKIDDHTKEIFEIKGTLNRVATSAVKK